MLQPYTPLTPKRLERCPGNHRQTSLRLEVDRLHDVRYRIKPGLGIQYQLAELQTGHQCLPVANGLDIESTIVGQGKRYQRCLVPQDLVRRCPLVYQLPILDNNPEQLR